VTHLDALNVLHLLVLNLGDGLVVDHPLDERLLVVHPAHLAGHDGLPEGLLRQRAVLPAVKALVIAVFLKRLRKKKTHIVVIFFLKRLFYTKQD
jgi:hypothetical protein